MRHHGAEDPQEFVGHGHDGAHLVFALGDEALAEGSQLGAPARGAGGGAEDPFAQVRVALPAEFGPVDGGARLLDGRDDAGVGGHGARVADELPGHFGEYLGGST